MNHNKPLLLAAAVCLAITACSRNDAPREPGEGPGAPADPQAAAAAPQPAVAMVKLESRSNSTVVGEFELRGTDGGVSLIGEVGGLRPGSEHAFHIHETGDCSAADASSAGGHLNPNNAPHGAPTVGINERHLGDLPNFVADENGRSNVTAAITGATLRDGGPNDVIGKAIIVHEGRDDYITQPSGNSGGRIACGVIR